MPENYNHKLNPNLDPQLNKTNKWVEAMVCLLFVCLVY
jgi:hypothetical protein